MANPTLIYTRRESIWHMRCKYIDLVPRNWFFSSSQFLLYPSIQVDFVCFPICSLSSFSFIDLSPFLLSLYKKNLFFFFSLHFGIVSLFISLTSMIHKSGKLITTDGYALASAMRESLPGLILKGSFLINFVAYGFPAVLFFHCFNKCLSVRGICHWTFDNVLYSAVLNRFGVIQFCICSINAALHFMLVIQSS